MGRRPKVTARTPGLGAQTGANFTLNTVLSVENFIPSFAHAQLQQDVGKIFILRGRNFDWDLRGPKSGYGNRRISRNTVHVGELVSQPKIFRVKERTLLFAAGKVYRLASDCADFEIEYEFPWRECGGHDEQHYPWSMAYVGQYYLFSHPYAGVIYYDELREVWGNHPLEGPCISSCIYGITAAKNRLIILTRDTVVYSEYDKPFSLLCSAYTGAGIQSLDEISKGIPYGVYPTRDGFVAYTSRGILSGRELQTSILQSGDPGQMLYGTNLLPQPAFNVDWHADEIVPIGPNAIAQIAGFEQIILTKRGFFRIDGRRALGELADQYSWESLIGMYLAEQELRDNRSADLKDIASIRLEYDWQWGKLFISMRDTHDRPYTRALVYQFDFAKWGSFDLTHWCIGPTHFDRVEYNKRKSTGFISYGGYACEFGLVASSAVRDREFWPAVIDGPCEGKLHPLDSFIEIGPFRRTDFEFASRFTHFTEAVLDMSPAIGESADNYKNTHRLTDNWEERAALEFPTNCKAYIGCSIDAHQIFEYNQQPMWLVDVDGRRRHYTFDNTGVSATILLQASQVGEYFHLHTVNVTAHMGGRY